MVYTYIIYVLDVNEFFIRKISSISWNIFEYVIINYNDEDKRHNIYYTK